MPASTPKFCVERRPTKRSVKFANQYINQSKLAAKTGLNQGNISRILTGRQDPSLEYARTLSIGLGMDLADFLKEFIAISSTSPSKVVEISAHIN